MEAVGAWLHLSAPRAPSAPSGKPAQPTNRQVTQRARVHPAGCSGLSHAPRTVCALLFPKRHDKTLGKVNKAYGPNVQMHTSRKQPWPQHDRVACGLVRQVVECPGQWQDHLLAAWC